MFSKPHLHSFPGRGQPPVTSSTIVIDKQPGGWRLNLGGTISYFGTLFLAMDTAVVAARKALASGKRTTVLIRKGDGEWQTAWTPDDPFPV